MSNPIRVQRKRTRGWKMPENTVSVTRPGPFGNPWSDKKSPLIAPEALPQVNVNEFRAWLDHGAAGYTDRNGNPFPIYVALDDRRTKLLKLLAELRGKNLACFCDLDAPCHADVLLELSNQ